MKTLKAFLLGIIEFKLNSTTHFDEDLIEVYDAGRELAHFLTFRHFES